MTRRLRIELCGRGWIRGRCCAPRRGGDPRDLLTGPPWRVVAIDGNDLVILSRSGDQRAKSAHDGNLITFHRVKNFRKLVY